MDAGVAAGSMTVLPDREQHAAFERDALPWLDDVYRFALSLTRDPDEARDVTQDAYLRALRSWHTFQPGSDCRRWLFTIARNVFLRARERDRHAVDLEEADAETLAGVRLHSEMRRSGEEEIFSRIDLGPALDEALGDLAEPFRSAVILVDVEDQSYEAASEILGVPIGTVRSRLFRGRRLLQEALLAHARDAGFMIPAPASKGSGTTR